MAQSKRRDGTFAVDISSRAGIFPVHFAGWEAGRTTSSGAVNLIGMDGGSPQTIAEKDTYGANWSPDGDLLVLVDPGGIHLLDPRTGKRSVVPDRQA